MLNINDSLRLSALYRTEEKFCISATVSNNVGHSCFFFFLWWQEWRYFGPQRKKRRNKQLDSQNHWSLCMSAFWDVFIEKSWCIISIKVESYNRDTWRRWWHNIANEVMICCHVMIFFKNHNSYAVHWTMSKNGYLFSSQSVKKKKKK